MKNTERFSNRVDNYIRYRPSYPDGIIDFLKTEIGLSNQTIIADIGSGTGQSSEIFLHNGNKVFGVEPNPEMREAAEKLFRERSNFISVVGTAEATTLADHSVDLIIAGQAFHWFDKALAKIEFKRIATPGAYVGLIWNDRNLDSPFQKAYEKLLYEFAPEYDAVKNCNLNREMIAEFFLPNPFLIRSFRNSQTFDFDGLKGRLLSCSYCPLEQDANYKPLMDGLMKVFTEHQKASKVVFEYSCNLYYGHI